MLTAGVGVTLLTRSATGNRARANELRWILARRGLILYGFGMAFDFIWPGTILPYYGAMFVLAAVLFTLRVAVADHDRRRRRVGGMAGPMVAVRTRARRARHVVADQPRPALAAWAC